MKSLSIIIPCYNEEESLPQLFSMLKSLEPLLINYDTEFIFIDDGSSDKTHDLLFANQSTLKKTRIVRHKVNQNLGAALKTGISHSKDKDLIAFLDSDCTYEPIILLHLLAAIESGADLATVSPYHKLGTVEGVPEWRILLSKGLTFCYKLILNSNYSTYTAMVRVLKAELATELSSQRDDFSFVAVMFIKAIQNNLKIIEVPTVLKVRRFGVSKINVLKTIKSHIGIIFLLLTKRKI